MPPLDFQVKPAGRQRADLPLGEHKITAIDLTESPATQVGTLGPDARARDHFELRFRDSAGRKPESIPSLTFILLAE